MLRTLTVAVAACAILGSPAQAQAPPAADSRAATDADLRCILIAAMYAGRVTDADQKAAIANGVGYLIGKIKAREPTADLKARMAAAASGLDAAALRPDFDRCSQELQAFGRESGELVAVLKSLGPQS